MEIAESIEPETFIAVSRMARCINAIFKVHINSPMRNSLLILFLFACQISCQTKKSKEGIDQTFYIDLSEPVIKKNPIEECIEDLQFVPLETNSNCYISTFSKYNLNKDFIVIYADATIHLFARNGRHIKSFNHRGKGPGEYGRLSNIDLIPERNEIMGVDTDQRKILCYDLDGKLTREIKTVAMPFYAVPLEGGLFAYYLSRLANSGQVGPDFHLVEIINLDGKILSKRLPYQFQLANDGGFTVSKSGENGIYFINPSFSYSIYQIGPGDQFFKKYDFSFGTYNIDTALLNNEKVQSGAKLSLAFNDKKKNLEYLAVTTNTISFWGPVIRNKIQFGTRQINRHTGNIRFIEVDSSNNSINYSGIPLEFPRKSTGDYFIITISAIDLLEAIRKLSSEQKKQLAKCKGFDRLPALKEDDNPVLVLYKVKNF